MAGAFVTWRTLLRQCHFEHVGFYMGSRQTISASNLYFQENLSRVAEKRQWSGSQGSLLNPSPIRTLLVGFPTHGSSLSKAAFQQPAFTTSNVWQLRRLYNICYTAFLRQRRRMHMR